MSDPLVTLDIRVVTHRPSETAAARLAWLLEDHPDDYGDWAIEVIDGVRWHVSPPDPEGVEGQQRVPCAEEPEPLWGPGGPEKGQVITIAGTSMQTRWNGHSWERVG